MDISEIEKISIDVLKDTPAEDELKKVFAIFEKAQVVALSLTNIKDEHDLTLTKIGTSSSALNSSSFTIVFASASLPLISHCLIISIFK